MDYGTGAIFGCPAHDQRDLDFARKYGLPVKPVILPPGADPATFDGRRRGLCRPGRRVQLGLPRRAPGRCGQGRGDRARRARWHRPGRHRLPPARLGRVAPALLGLPDPDGALRRVRHPARAAGPAAGGAAGRRELRPARQPVGAPPHLEAHDLPELRRPGRARDRHARHLRRLLLVLPALHQPARPSRRSTARRPTTGCRSTSTSAASSTRSCTCSTPASSPARWPTTAS